MYLILIFREAFVKDAELSNLLLDEFFRDAIHKCQGAWRDVISKAVECGIPTPAFSTALAFYDGYRAQRSPANLIQVLGKFPELSLFSERSKFTLNCAALRNCKKCVEIILKTRVFFRFRHNVITLVPIRMNFCETLASSFTLIGQVLVDLYHLQLTMLEGRKSPITIKVYYKVLFFV